MHYLRYLNGTSQLNEEIKESTIVIDGIEVKSEIKNENLEPPAGETEEEKQARLEKEKLDKEKIDNTDTNRIVSIDDGTGAKDYILDDDGNATLDGRIVFTKQQLDDAENANNNDDLDKDDIHKSISQISGLELNDENGNPIQFKPGIEGLAEREVYIKELFYKQGKNEAILDIFEKNPDIKEMYSYKQKHGSLEGYGKMVDYSKLEITDNTTTDELKVIIKEHLSKLGNDSSYIDRFIKLSESDETLKVDALNSLNKLKEIQANEEVLEAENTARAEKLEIEKYERYYGVSYDKTGKLIDKNVEGSVYDKIVKSGKIGNILIPKEGIVFSKEDGTKTNMSRLDLFNYFYKPVAEQNGIYYTKAQLDENKRLKDTDNFLIQGIRNITGNDLKSLEQAMKNTLLIKSAKDIIKITSKSKTEQNNNLSNKDIEKQIKAGTAEIIFES